MPTAHPDHPNEHRTPFPDHVDAVAEGLVTAGAFIALADGGVAPVERDVIVRRLARGPFTSTLSEQRIAGMFDQQVRRLGAPGAADLIVDALRPLTVLSFASEVVQLATRAAAADGRLARGELDGIALIRLLMAAMPSPRLVTP
jgi:tellurite resistance protein